MPRYRRVIGATGVFVILLAILFPAVAVAHESRTVGKYTFVVGFLVEPAIQGQPNGLDLTITDANSNPVVGAEKTLKVGIAFGGSATKDLPLLARFGLKGKYTADVIPTKVGTYAYVFTGTVNGDTVNERFESGPGRFDDVVSPTALQFPAVADTGTQANGSTATADAAMQRATLLGGAGIAIGLIGIILGVVAMATRSRSAEPALDEETHSGEAIALDPKL